MTLLRWCGRLLVALALLGSGPTGLAHAAGTGGPKWSQLKADEQRVLAPLKDDWDQLDAQRKRNWLGVAKRYPTMKPEEQARMQERMAAWASLSPEQRRAARDTYRRQAQLPPERRETLPRKWEEYQQSSQPAARSADDGAVVPTAVKE